MQIIKNNNMIPFYGWTVNGMLKVFNFVYPDVFNFLSDIKGWSMILQ